MYTSIVYLQLLLLSCKHWFYLLYNILGLFLTQNIKVQPNGPNNKEEIYVNSKRPHGEN